MQSGRELARGPSRQVVTGPAGGRRERIDGGRGLTPVQRVQDLQRLAGNQAVAELLSVQRQGRSGQRRTPTPAQSNAALVREQVRLGRLLDQEQQLPPGVAGPPAPGGAFWLLNGLNATDLYDTLRECGAPVRQTLLAHVAETEGRYDRPRLELALRTASWNERSAGTGGLTLLDTLRSAGTGPLTAVWARLGGQSRPALIGLLRALPRQVRQQLLDRVGEAPAGDQTVLRQVLADLQGTGTDMTADDVVDVNSLRGLDRTMANIYNFRGQLLQERAQALGIGTAAAAGIMKVESGGRTFDPNTNRTIARFENHVLWGRWGSLRANRAAFNTHFDFNRTGHVWEGHRFRENPAGAWEAMHANQQQEWRVIAFAARLAGDVAYECASFGAGQIMGFNHANVGFASAREMVDSYNVSERSQITGIFEFIAANHLTASIRAGDYLTLAKRYNGGGQAAVYARLITDAADAYRRVTAGKRHVIAD